MKEMPNLSKLINEVGYRNISYFNLLQPTTSNYSNVVGVEGVEPTTLDSKLLKNTLAKNKYAILTRQNINKTLKYCTLSK